jgi:hypothetical protein
VSPPAVVIGLAGFGFFLLGLGLILTAAIIMTTGYDDLGLVYGHHYYLYTVYPNL